MPYKDSVKQAEYQSRYYQDRREVWRARNVDKRSKKRLIVHEWKLRNPCIVCGESDPIVIDPHHVDQSTKSEKVSTLVMDMRSDKRIIDELQKCVGMCANCHRRHHRLGLR